MSSQAVIPVQIRGLGDKVSPGTVEHQAWQKRERTLRALKALGITWGLAVAAVLIPLLHFVLVPLLLLAGPAVFVWIAGQEEMILGGRGTCPECGKPLEIAKSTVKWPLKDICTHCHAQLTVERQG
jgi:hypothetical protein